MPSINAHQRNRVNTLRTYSMCTKYPQRYDRNFRVPAETAHNRAHTRRAAAPTLPPDANAPKDTPSGARRPEAENYHQRVG